MLKLLPNKYQATAIPKQNFYAVSALCPEHDQCSIEGILPRAAAARAARLCAPRRKSTGRVANMILTPVGIAITKWPHAAHVAPR